MYFVIHAALFYYTLGNIRPSMRATLKTIQLIAAVTYPNLQQYGFEPVLKPFVEDVNKLSEVRALLHVINHFAEGKGACTPLPKTPHPLTCILVTVNLPEN